MNKKRQINPSGIKPATFRLVAQCLNQLSTPLHMKYVHTAQFSTAGKEDIA
jgi:hypothetical protein